MCGYSDSRRVLVVLGYSWVDKEGECQDLGGHRQQIGEEEEGGASAAQTTASRVKETTGKKQN